ncbi:MAG: hypothetical protein V3U73_11910, partial [bacterium]
SGSIIPSSKRLYDVIPCLPDLSYPISNGRLCHLAEEEHLRNIHGEEYARYCERVPRYLRALGG